MPDTKLQNVLHDLFRKENPLREFATFSDPSFDLSLTSLRSKIVLFTVFLGIFVCPIFAGFYYWLGDDTNALLCVSGCVLAIIILGLVWKTRRYRLARELLLMGSFAIIVALCIRLGGAASPVIMWLAICPTVAIMTEGYKSSLVWTSITIVTVIGLYVLTELQISFPVSPITDLTLLNTVSSASLLLVFFLALAGYERVNLKLMRQLDESYRHIQRLATIDELTGAINRRELLRRLETEISRAKRTNIPFSLCILDIDHFKNINDAYGHPAGDTVLIELCRFIESEIRDVDIFGRYGGEEFLLLLPSADLRLAEAMAERLRKKIASRKHGHLEKQRITVSIGLTEYKPDERAFTVIARADQALYRAKEAGRNRIQVVG